MAYFLMSKEFSNPIKSFSSLDVNKYSFSENFCISSTLENSVCKLGGPGSLRKFFDAIDSSFFLVMGIHLL